MKIRKTTLTIGFNDKDTKKQDTYGAYTHDDGNVVIESGCCVVLYFTDEQKDSMICESLKRQLNQESIAVESGLVDSKLI